MGLDRTRGFLKQVPPVRGARKVYRAFQEFTRLEASGGIVLMATAAVALLWANSPWSQSYFDLWHMPLAIQIGNQGLSHDLHWWINESLMVIFFFVVGLEIKREILVGELSSLRQAALPIAAAIGGMLLPAVAYALLNLGTPGIRGWGIPMATDIAFTLGVLALLGPRVPVSLKVFLTALAIVDDIGAVLVIAIFYSGQISWLYLAFAAVILAVLILANLLGARSPILFALMGIALWLAFLQSGVHATLAGVLLAFTIPAHNKIRAGEFVARAQDHINAFQDTGDDDLRMISHQQQEALQALEDASQEVQTPLQRLEHALHPWVIYAIIPLFALANAGVTLGSEIAALLTDRISLGIIAGLVLGKQFGVTLASWLAVKAGWADLPNNVTWKQIYGAGWLAGIGFTMSLFIAGLAFEDPARLEAAKVGILVASLVAGGVGYTILRLFLAPTSIDPPADSLH